MDTIIAASEFEMFESLLSNFLSSRLTQFVKHIDTENLKVGIWKGEVSTDSVSGPASCFRVESKF